MSNCDAYDRKNMSREYETRKLSRFMSKAGISVERPQDKTPG